MPKSTPPSPASFESTLAELEAIVRSMEEGQLPLETALDQYQKGIELLKHCQATLNAAQVRMQVLENEITAPMPGMGSTK